jgi:hypothetical protein
VVQQEPKPLRINLYACISRQQSTSQSSRREAQVIDDGNRRHHLVDLNVRIKDNRCQITMVTTGSSGWRCQADSFQALLA